MAFAIGNLDQRAYFTGNVGVGTTDPQAKLDVNGNIKIGGGTPISKIIAGSFNTNGSKRSGSGFTSTRLSGGKYRITFDSAFSSVPLVIATANNEDDQSISVVPSINDAVFHCYEMNHTNGSKSDTLVSFFVIGL